MFKRSCRAETCLSQASVVLRPHRVAQQAQEGLQLPVAHGHTERLLVRVSQQQELHRTLQQVWRLSQACRRPLFSSLQLSASWTELVPAAA